MLLHLTNRSVAAGLQPHAAKDGLCIPDSQSILTRKLSGLGGVDGHTQAEASLAPDHEAGAAAGPLAAACALVVHAGKREDGTLCFHGYVAAIMPNRKTRGAPGRGRGHGPFQHRLLCGWFVPPKRTGKPGVFLSLLYDAALRLSLYWVQVQGISVSVSV